MLKTISEKDLFPVYLKLIAWQTIVGSLFLYSNQNNIRGYSCIWSVAIAFHIKGAQRQTHRIRSTEVRKRPSYKSVTLELPMTAMSWSSRSFSRYTNLHYGFYFFNRGISRDMIKQYFRWDKKSSHCLLIHLHSTMVSAVVSKLKINWSLEFP